MLLTAPAIAVLLLWLLAGCTNGKGDGAGQQQGASEDESSSSRINYTSCGAHHGEI